MLSESCQAITLLVCFADLRGPVQTQRPSSVLPKSTCELHLYVLVANVNLALDEYEELCHLVVVTVATSTWQMFRKRAMAAGQNPNTPAFGKL